MMRIPPLVPKPRKRQYPPKPLTTGLVSGRKFENRPRSRLFAYPSLSSEETAMGKSPKKGGALARDLLEVEVAATVLIPLQGV